MYARVSTLTADKNRMDDGIRRFEQELDDQAPEGFQEYYLLVDRQGGRAIAITLWDSREAAERTTDEANEIRERLAQGFGGRIENVEILEVATHERVAERT